MNVKKFQLIIFQVISTTSTLRFRNSGSSKQDKYKKSTLRYSMVKVLKSKHKFVKAARGKIKTYCIEGNNDLRQVWLSIRNDGDKEDKKMLSRILHSGKISIKNVHRTKLKAVK